MRKANHSSPADRKQVAFEPLRLKNACARVALQDIEGCALSGRRPLSFRCISRCICVLGKTVPAFLRTRPTIYIVYIHFIQLCTRPGLFWICPGLWRIKSRKSYILISLFKPLPHTSIILAMITVSVKTTSVTGSVRAKATFTSTLSSPYLIFVQK